MGSFGVTPTTLANRSHFIVFPLVVLLLRESGLKVLGMTLKKEGHQQACLGSVWWKGPCSVI